LFLVVCTFSVLAATVTHSIYRPFGYTAATSNEASPKKNPANREARTGCDFSTLSPQLDKLMVASKPFKDPQLTIKHLADEMGISTRKLSVLVNDAYQCRFVEFINRARVDEAKRLMRDPDWLDCSLIDIAAAAGFKSKSSFNLMFKRFSEQTPSLYRREL
jgi:AraC-like DNA-binding protein